MIDRDDIIKLAREAGFITGVTHASSGYSHPFVHPVAFPTCLVELERFAALVAAAEREACAKVCDPEPSPPNEAYIVRNNKATMRRCAATIRARSNT